MQKRSLLIVIFSLNESLEIRSFSAVEKKERGKVLFRRSQKKSGGSVSSGAEDVGDEECYSDVEEKAGGRRGGEKRARS